MTWLEADVLDVLEEKVIQAGRGGTRIDQIVERMSEGVPRRLAEEFKTINAASYVENGVVDVKKLGRKVEAMYEQVYKHTFALFMEDFVGTRRAAKR